MANTPETSWYSMMGLTKVLLRNFVVGCFLLCIFTITTLASILNTVNQERLRDERDNRNAIIELNNKCAEKAEFKNQEYVIMLKEALEHQQLLIRELDNLEKKYIKKQ